jgi:hypothetical protein
LGMQMDRTAEEKHPAKGAAQEMSFHNGRFNPGLPRRLRFFSRPTKAGVRRAWVV